MCKRNSVLSARFSTIIRARISSPMGIPTMRNSAETCPVSWLTVYGKRADILRYNHRGVVSTVVNF